MAKVDLEKLVERLKGGDSVAFDLLYESTYKVVFFASYNILGDKLSAENITQETYFKVFNKIGEYKSKNILAYLVVTAKNLSINEKKRFNRNVFVDFTDNETVYDTRYATIPQSEEIGLIDTARKLLSEQDFQIITMCVIAGYKRREVAKILDLPISTVSYRYKTALNTLKNYLKRGGGINEY